MAIDIHRIDQGRGIEVICSGKMTGSEILASKTSKTHNDLSGVRYFLIDYSNVTQSFVSVDEVKLIAQYDREMLTQYPDMFLVAIVPNEIFKAMSGLWESYADVDSSKIKHFDTRPQAECWIGMMLAE